MALYHFTCRVIQRSAGQTATAAAAACAADRIQDQRAGLVHDHRQKNSLAFSQIMLPPDVPA